MLFKLSERPRGLETFPRLRERTLARSFAAALIFELFSHIRAVLKIYLHVLWKELSYYPLSLVLIVL